MKSLQTPWETDGSHAWRNFGDKRAFIRLDDGAWYLSNSSAIEPDKFREATPRKHAPSPRLGIVLHLTNSCNLNCGYCYARQSGAGTLDISPTVITDLIRVANNSAFTHLNFVFHGGEPLTRWSLVKDIVETINSSSNKQCSFGLQTNGVGIMPAQVDFIKKHAIHLSVSLDGSQEDHDQNRCHTSGRGSFDQVISSINLLHQENVRFSVNSVLRAESDPDSYFRTIVEQGIRNINLTPIGYPASVRQESHQAEKILSNYIAILSHVVQFNKTNTSRIIEMGAFSKISAISGRGGLSRCDNYPCHKTRNSIMLDQVGNVFPCEEWYGQAAASVGNIAGLGSLNLTKDCSRFHAGISQQISDYCGNCMWGNYCGRICPKYFAAGDYSLCEFYRGTFDFLFSLAVQGTIQLLTPKRTA